MKADKGLGRVRMDDERDKDYLISDALKSSQLEKQGSSDEDYQYWWTSGWWGNQGATPQCFPPGTMVTMADGSEKPIEEIRAGEKVLTHEGNTEMVEAVMAREYEGELVEMEVRGYRQKLRSTPEHPWYVSTLGKEHSRKSGRRGQIVTKETDWKEAEDIVPYASDHVEAKTGGPALNIPRTSPPTNPEPILSTTDYLDDHRVQKEAGEIRIHGCSHEGSIREDIPVTKELGRILGRYLAEGHVQKDRNASLQLSFGGHEEELASETAQSIENVFDVETHYRHRPSNVIQLNAYSSTLSALFEGLVGNGCANKGFHPDMWQWPDQILDEVWWGYHDGDGYHDESGDRIVLTTVSETLARDLWRLGNRLGYMPLIHTTEADERRQKAYRIACTRMSDLEEYGELKSKGRSRIWNEDYIRCPVQDVSKSDYNGLVYNLQVANDRSYIADGFAVHNCVAYAWMHWLEDGPVTHFYEDRDFDPWYEDDDQHCLFNPKSVYDECQRRDRWPGESYDGTSVRAGAKVLKDKGVISEYRWGWTLDDLIQGVLQFGPVVVGTYWYEDMYEPDEDGIVSVSGRKVGGHAYVVNGINKDKGLARAKNSWSRQWGDDGHFWIPLDPGMKRLIEGGGEVCLATEKQLEE